MNIIEPPKLPSLLVNKGSRGSYYVYTYTNVWDSERKRSKRTNSKLVGEIIGGQKEGVVRFKEEFINEYPSLAFFNVTKKGKKFDFEKIDEDTIVSKIAQDKHITLHAGATWVLNHIVGKTPIAKALNEVFNQNKDDLKIISLAYFLILNENNNMNRYEEFAECTYLPFQRPMNGSVITRLFKRITDQKIDRFITLMNDYYFKTKKDTNSPVFLAFDSTSISTYSNNLAKSEYGRNKDGDDLKQINVVMLVDQSNGLPLFYRAYDGAVPDIATVRRTIADCTRVGLKDNVVFVADKGYMSKKNIDDCLINNYSFIFNTKVNVKNSLIQQEVDEVYNELISASSYCRAIRQNVITKTINWTYDAYPIKNKRCSNKDKAKLNLHIYFNKDIQNNAYNTILDSAATVCEAVNNNNGKLSGLPPLYATILENYLDYDYSEEDNCYTKVKISNTKIAENIKYKGVRVLITDQQSFTAEQCHNHYFDRNKVEYSFNTLKYRINCNRYRCSDDLVFEGKSFVQFIATAISMLVRYALNEHKEECKDKKYQNRIIYESDGKILASLNNIMAHVFKAGIMFDEVVGKKVSFLQALGVPVPENVYFGVNDSNYDEIIHDLEIGDYTEELQNRELDRVVPII